jgi:hypothetical protein
MRVRPQKSIGVKSLQCHARMQLLSAADLQQIFAADPLYICCSRNEKTEDFRRKTLLARC